MFSDEEVCELEDYFNTGISGINCDKVGSDLFGEEDLEAFAQTVSGFSGAEKHALYEAMIDKELL